MLQLQSLRRGFRGIIQVIGILFLTLFLKSSLGVTSTIVHANLSAVTAGNYSTLWLIDGGANKSITPFVNDFTSNYRSIDVNIQVAKLNTTMKAIGVGDCTLNCLDNRGKPCKIKLTNVLHVPEASRSLISSSSLSVEGYQTVLPSAAETFPSGLYLPKQKKLSTFIPLSSMNGLYFIACRSDGKRDVTESKENMVIKLSRKMGHCPLQVLWDTRKVVKGLEHLDDTHFSRNFITSDVRKGKLVQASVPHSTENTPSRPNEVWHMDTIGPMPTTSVHGFKFNTSFTCGFSGYVLSYGHASTSQIPEIQEKWYADIAKFREIHGEPRILRCDNASVNMSRRAAGFRLLKGIRTETICPHESHQAGVAERMNRTLVTGTRTVLLASGLDNSWWHHALMYQSYLQNIKYSSITHSSPHVLMLKSMPDVSNLQEFGIEGWLYRREDQRKDRKLDARGEPIIFVGYPTNQQGYLVWCHERRGSKVSIATTNNVVFGSRCPRSIRSLLEIINEDNLKKSIKISLLLHLL